MSSYVASVSAPLMLHGGKKTHPRIFQRPPDSPLPGYLLSIKKLTCSIKEAFFGTLGFLLRVIKSLKNLAYTNITCVTTSTKAKAILKENGSTLIEIEGRPQIGSSKWFPNIQEMVKKDPLLVLERYIRSPEEMELDKIILDLSPFIPVIDFAMLKNGNTEELLKLDYACKEWGFFQLVNHGVEELMHRMKDTTIEFFNLPLEEKEKYAMQEDIQGYGHIQVQPKDQKLDWSDALVLFTEPARHIKPSIWPKNPKGFKDIIEEYSSGVTQVGLELLNYLSVNLGMQKDVLFELHEEIASFLDVNYYPPCHKPDRVLAMNRHCDCNSITLVMQDQIDVTELQINHHGSWVPVNPILDALVVNVGDLIEIWSNGRYKSIEHRVVTNESKLRISHVTGLLPAKDVPVHI